MPKNEPKVKKRNGEITVGGVVLTGGSTGIGAALITTIHKHNPSIRIFNLSRTKPVEKFVTHWSCDLSKSNSIEKVESELKKEIQAVEGGILLINNSGLGKYGAFPRPEWEVLRDLIQVNLVAPLELTARLLPLIQEKGGGVINVCSTAAFQPTPFFSVYGASKAFLLHWSLSLWREQKEKGVHVLSVCPGPTATNFFRAAGFSERVKTPGGLSAEEVAEEIWKGWLQRKPLIVNGLFNRLLAWISGALPRTISTRLSEKVLKHYRLDLLEED